MASEFYTVSIDIISGSVDVSTLREEIIADPVVPNSSYIIYREAIDQVEIAFPIALNSTEKTALDAVVANHPTIDTGNPDETTGTYKENRDPTFSDDLSADIGLGDIWINQISNTAFINVDNTIGAAQWDEVGSGNAGNFDDIIWITSGELVYIIRPPNRSEVITI